MFYVNIEVEDFELHDQIYKYKEFDKLEEAKNFYDESVKIYKNPATAGCITLKNEEKIIEQEYYG